MKRLGRIVWILGLLLISCSFVNAETVEKNKYYLRHNLIFFNGEIPKVSPQNIVFTDESICGFYPKVYNSPILQRDTEVNIVTIDKSDKQAKMIFEAEQEKYEILISNTSDKEFKKSFALAFSTKVSNVRYKYPKNWGQMIKQFGFPIAQCKENKGWFYILEFSPAACGSYDGCVMKITPKGLEVSGYI
jgi:hypothetical protein